MRRGSRPAGMQAERPSEAVQLKLQQTFVGPNLYSVQPGILVRATLPESAPRDIAALGDGFCTDLTGLLERLCLRPGLDGDILAARNLGELLAAFAVNLQRHAGAHVERGHVVTDASPGRYLVFYECETADVGLQAGGLAAELISHLLSEQGHGSLANAADPAGRLKKLVAFVKQHGLRGEHRYLMAAAREAGIPASVHDGGWLQLGHGRYRRLMRQTFTDVTPWAAVARSSDKVYTNQLLRGLGLLVPAQRVVNTAEQALAAARVIGFPVVVKPRRQDRQIGVTVGIENERDLTLAFKYARKYGRDVIVEELLRGGNYRAIVIDGEIVSIMERHRAHVSGDGKHTVAELVEIANQDPRRSHSGSMPLVLLAVDAEAEAALAAQGRTPASVPQEGERVFLSQFPYARVSEETRDVTDIIHPELAEAMLLGVRALGLDIAGVDYITPDITRPPAEAGGGFCEINCTPMLQPHFATRPRDIAGPVFKLLFDGGRPVHVPIAVVCGDGRQQRVRRLLTPAFEEAGYGVGSASRDGLWAAGKQLTTEDATGPQGARTLLQDPRIEAAILETPARVVAGQGLGVEGCDVAIIQGVPEPDAEAPPSPALPALKAIAALAQRAVVIGADHPLRSELTADRDPGDVIVVSIEPNAPYVAAHLSRGGAALAFDGSATPPVFTLTRAGSETQIVCPALDGGTRDGRCITAVAFAMAGALALDISADAVARHAAEIV